MDTIAPYLFTSLIVSTLIFALLSLFLLLRIGGPFRTAGLPPELSAGLSRIDTLTREMEILTRAFTVPRTRGGMGERLLEDLLKAWLPPQYIHLQHQFSTGARVDAAVRVGSRLVSIDAKFPYESLVSLLGPDGDDPKRSRGGELRKVFTPYVDDIAKKYIRPEEGTFHFALLYIPSENLFYRAFIEEQAGLMDYALKQSVVPVSPGSLFIYLQTVAIGLRGFALTDRQKELLDTLHSLQRDFRSFAKIYSVAGTHLRNASRSFDESLIRFSRLESSLERAVDMSPGENPNGKDPS